MSLFSGYKSKFDIACDSGRPGIVRAFALAELVCQPVSIASVVAALVLAILRRTGVWTPPAVVADWLVPIFVSAAVGYHTNWIAITMLFEPYERTWRHWLPWVTFGGWRQGLVPKNKARIASVLADQVATKLLRPEKLADDLCSMVGRVLEDKTIVSAVQDALQSHIQMHDKEIVACLAPKIEGALVVEIDRLVTAESIETFWDEQIAPKLQSKGAREEIAGIVIGALDKRAPRLAAKIRPLVITAIRNWVEEKGGIFGPLLSPVAEKLADAIVDKRTIERGLREWLNDPATVPALRDELLQFVGAVRAYLKSPEAQAKVGVFATDIRAKFKAYVRTYLETHFAATVSGILRSEQLWQWAASLIPRFRPELENLIRTKGLPHIVNHLDIEGRVKTAVDCMDMAEFHGMLNQVMAEHLGAIQVLGYLLGAIAGLLLSLT